jgi:predicted unusual protein kinase regulating ubiquinone biosynthesis (AarF/ABC1/UbiB family)
LRQAYGENWRDHLRIEEGSILGSGCIAQVYKGYIRDDEGQEQPVAIKVVHPRVRSTIAKDLGILRFLARSMERLPFGIGEDLKWNNLSGAVEEFAAMLEPQLDLRNEANHIERFNKDFASKSDVIFPELVKGYQSSSDILVETFCSGVTLEEFCEQHKDDKELRAKMCELGARTMCEMIFNNNFVHADVHAGNILISPDNKLILLDCGIANEYSERDHDLAINVIAAFIRMDGRRAAEFLIENSNQHMQETTGEQALEVEKYLDEIAEISKTPVQGDFAFKKVSMYINFIMNAASRHHVRITPAFVSMALAIKVQEGIALKLNPHSSIIHVANPIIMKAEARRFQKGGFQRWKTIADDTWRDFKVRRERERNARLLGEAQSV